MGTMYVIDDTIRQIAVELKRKFPNNLSEANLENIVFMSELESPSKTKLAVTKKMDKAWKAIYPDSHYLVIVFRQRWDNLTLAQKHILVFHQLMFCEFDGEKLRKPEVQQFFELASKFGINWEDDENVMDPLADDFNEVLAPKPVLEPDKYTNIMREDHDLGSNVSSQYYNDDED